MAQPPMMKRSFFEAAIGRLENLEINLG